MTATLFLDVDGVLSPLRGPSSAWDDWEEVPFNDYHLLLSRSMAGRIAELPAKIVWLTTWRHLANTHIGEWLGWKTYDVVDPGHAVDAERWKVAAVEAHVEAGGEPFVWIDDNLDAMAPNLEPLLGNYRHLLIAPDPNIGLTPHDLDRVEAFLVSLDDV